MRAPELRLRAPTPGLLGLPWDRPLSEWVVPDVPLRDIAVGPSRHLVKFVDADGQLVGRQGHAPRVAVKEYDVLRRFTWLSVIGASTLSLFRNSPAWMWESFWWSRNPPSPR